MASTPADKWKSKIVKLRKQCQTILNLSDNIRYVGVINPFGRTLTGIIKPGLKPLLKSEQVKNEFFIMSTLISLRKNPATGLGRLEHVLLQHHKVTILAMQKNSMTYYISINKKERDLEKIISAVKKI